MEPLESLINRLLMLRGLSKKKLTLLESLEILRLVGFTEEELSRIELWMERGD